MPVTEYERHRLLTWFEEHMEFDSKLDRLRSDLQRTFVTSLFLSQAAVIAAVGVLLALLR